MKAIRRGLMLLLWSSTLTFPVVAQEIADPEATAAADPASDEITVELPEDEDAEKDEPSPCLSYEKDAAWIDYLESRLHRLTCSTSNWFDGLFGDRRHDEDYRATHGMVTAGAAWSERTHFDKILRFRARVYLPQLKAKVKDRFSAFVGRVDEEEFVTENAADNELHGLPKAFGDNLDDSTLLGLGYNEPLRKRGSFDADVGVRVRFPVDPYARGSYRYARPLGTRNLFRLRETVFWQNSEGFGTTARIDWDRVLNGEQFLRWSGSGTFSEKSDGVRWYSALTLYNLLGDERALAFEGMVTGSTDYEVPLTNFGVTTIFRQSVFREWIWMDLRVGVDWPRDVLLQQRRANLNAALSFEMRYGLRERD